MSSREMSDREEAAIKARWPGEWVFAPRMAFRRSRTGITHDVRLSHKGFACTRTVAGITKTVHHAKPKEGLLEAEDLLRSACDKVLRELE